MSSSTRVARKRMTLWWLATSQTPRRSGKHHGAQCTRVKVCYVVGDSAPYGVHVPVGAVARRPSSGRRVQGLAFQEGSRPQHEVEESEKHAPLHEGPTLDRRLDVATAPGHLLGQIIGNVMEEALAGSPKTWPTATTCTLDSDGPRPGVRPGAHVAWTDDFGNSHDLDFVLERGGSARKLGNPAAFVEAWEAIRNTPRRRPRRSRVRSCPCWRSGTTSSPRLPLWSLVNGLLLPSNRCGRAASWSLHLDFATTSRVFSEAGIDIEGLGRERPTTSGSGSATPTRARVTREKRQLATAARGAWRRVPGLHHGAGRRVMRTIDYVVVTPLHGNGNQYALGWRRDQGCPDILLRCGSSSVHPL